jgi:hypothetical protein
MQNTWYNKEVRNLYTVCDDNIVDEYDKDEELAKPLSNL